MEKGIAITTILTLLVGIVVVGIIVFLAYGYIPSPVLDESECRARLISWCTSCKVKGWVGGIAMSEELANCTSEYFYPGTADGIDCDDNYQVKGSTCSAGNCPNETVCKVVGAGV